MLWSASIKDWLILVAGRVSESGAKSTAPLFQGLQDAIGEMVVLIEKNRGRSRISKMLNSGNFTRIFEQAKSPKLKKMEATSKSVHVIPVEKKGMVSVQTSESMKGNSLWNGPKFMNLL